MVKIGMPYLVHKEDKWTRLCADVSMEDRTVTLWFGVAQEQEGYLTQGRCDPFVMALLPFALRGGHDMVCEGAMSERLHYQLEHYLIPILAAELPGCSNLSVSAALKREPVENLGGVGVALLGDEEEPRVLLARAADSQYPPTHLASFRWGEQAGFDAHGLAQETGLEYICLDSNLSRELPEDFASVRTFRSLAGAMALQGVFSVYWHFPGFCAAGFAFDPNHSAAYDLLSVHCAQTETLTVFQAADREACADGKAAEPRRTIAIGKPYVRKENDRAFLCAPVTMQRQTREAWFSVEPEYAPYLTHERSDAFVVGFLTTALRLGADIQCDAPITKQLYNRLTTALIPALANNMKVFRPIAIHAPVTTAVLESAGAVGTGWTGGVDCTFTLMTHMENEHPHYRLTHLVVANNGAIESADAFEMLNYMTQRAREGAAKEYGLSVVGVDSNLHLLQNETYLSTAAYRLPAVALALQKLFRVFLNSAGPAFSYFRLDQEDTSHYELLPLSCFETDSTEFYSAGCKFNRVEKLSALSEFPLAQKGLHPCRLARGSNCSRCHKCTRSMFALYAMEKLENFHQVFDLEWFYGHKDEILEEILLAPEQSLHSKILLDMQKRRIAIPAEVKRKVRIRRAALAARKKWKAKEERE